MYHYTWCCAAHTEQCTKTISQMGLLPLGNNCAQTNNGPVYEELSLVYLTITRVSSPWQTRSCPT